jgi:hypothetical protein
LIKSGDAEIAGPGAEVEGIQVLEGARNVWHASETDWHQPIACPCPAGLVDDRSARGAVSGPDDKDYSRIIQQLVQPLPHCFASGEIPVEPERNVSILQCPD